MSACLTVTDFFFVLFFFVLSKICPLVSHRVGRSGCSQKFQSSSKGAGCPRHKSFEEIRCTGSSSDSQDLWCNDG